MVISMYLILKKIHVNDIIVSGNCLKLCEILRISSSIKTISK